MPNPLQALFDSFGHNNVLVNGRVEQGPVTLNDGDLIEVKPGASVKWTML